MNKVTLRQVSVLILILSITFKLSHLPSLMSQTFGRSSTLIVAIYTVMDILIGILIYRLVICDGLNVIEQNANKIYYKVTMSFFALYFIFKLCLVYGGVILFVIEQLFETIATVEISFLLILPLAYLAYCGMASIARTAEFFIWYIVLVIMINFFFLKTNMDFNNNLPILTDDFRAIIAKSPKFLLWYGDFTPLIFVALKRTKNSNKLPIIAVVFSFVVIIVSYLFVFAIYGDSAEYIGNFIVKLSGFNMFSRDIGRLDWLGITAWLIMSVIYCACFLWAAKEALRRVIPFPKLDLAIVCVILIAIEIFFKDMNNIINLAQSPIGYFALIGNYAIPLILFITCLLCERKAAKERNEKVSV